MFRKPVIPRLSDSSQAFNATSDLINWGTWGFNSTGLTLSCWVYFNSLSSTRDDRFISKADGTAAANHDWMLGKTFSGANHYLRIRALRDGITLIGTTTAIVTDRWYHAVGVAGLEAGSGIKRLYLNGLEVGFVGGGGVSLSATTNTIYIGNQPTSATSAPDGLISDPAVWSRILLPEEIKALAGGKIRPVDIADGLESYLPGSSLKGYRGRNAVSTSTFVRNGPPQIANRKKYWYPSTVATGSSGTVTQTLANTTSAITGTTTITSALAETLDNAVLTASGSVPSVGTLAITLANTTLVASGTSAVTGTLTATLANATLAASGSVDTVNSGTVAATLENTAPAISGTTTVIGSVALTVQDTTISANGTTEVVGTLAETLNDTTLSAFGSVGNPVTTEAWRLLRMPVSRLGM